MFWVYVRSSASFSIERCRYPITMSASMIFSPSKVSRSRKTPCVLGCCGPRLTTNGSVRTVKMLAPAAERLRRLAGEPLEPGKASAWSDEIVLAQWPAIEPIPQEHAAQVRMPNEHNAHQVIR